MIFFLSLKASKKSLRQTIKGGNEREGRGSSQLTTEGLAKRKDQKDESSKFGSLHGGVGRGRRGRKLARKI